MTQGAPGDFSPGARQPRMCLVTVLGFLFCLWKDLELGTEGTLMYKIDWVFLQSRSGERH